MTIVVDLVIDFIG